MLALRSHKCIVSMKFLSSHYSKAKDAIIRVLSILFVCELASKKCINLSCGRLVEI